MSTPRKPPHTVKHHTPGWNPPPVVKGPSEEDSYSTILHACDECDTPMWCKAGNAVCRKWLRSETA